MLTPKPIDVLTGKKIVKIFCGSAHSAAITEQGELYTWGKGSRKLLGNSTSAIYYNALLMNYEFNTQLSESITVFNVTCQIHVHISIACMSIMLTHN